MSVSLTPGFPGMQGELNTSSIPFRLLDIQKTQDQKTYKEIQQELEAILKEDPDNPETLLVYAEVAVSHKQTRKANECLERLLLVNPQNTEALIIQAELQAQDPRQLSKAEHTLRQLGKELSGLNLEESRRTALLRLRLCILKGQIYSQKREDKKAFEEFTKALEIDQNYPPAFNALAEFYLKNGKYNEALEEVQKALNLCPDYKQAVILKGLLLQKIRGHLDPSYVQKYSTRPVLDYLERRYRRSKEAFLDLFLALHCNQEEVQGMRSARSESLRRENRLGQLNQAIQEDPRNFAALIERAQIVIETDPEAALQDTRSILNQDPHHQQAVIIQAYVYLSRNEPEQALVLLEEISRECSNSLIATLQAYCYFEQGNLGPAFLDAAFRKLDEALQYDPNYILAFRVRAEFYLRLDKYAEAFQEIERALKISPQDQSLLLLEGLILQKMKNFRNLELYREKCRHIPEFLTFLQMRYEHIIQKAVTLESLEFFSLLFLLNPPFCSFCNIRGKMESWLGQKYKTFKPHLEQARQYLKEGNFAEALSELEPILSFHQSSHITSISHPCVALDVYGEALSIKAAMHLENGEYEQVLAVSMQISRESRHYTKGVMNQIIAHTLLGEYQEALSKWNLFVKEKPDFSLITASFFKAWIHFCQNASQEALEEFAPILKRMLTINLSLPQKAFFLSTSAEFYLTYKQYDAALLRVGQALKIYPSNRVLLQEGRVYQARDGSLPPAYIEKCRNNSSFLEYLKRCEEQLQGQNITPSESTLEVILAFQPYYRASPAIPTELQAVSDQNRSSADPRRSLPLRSSIEGEPHDFSATAPKTAEKISPTSPDELSALLTRAILLQNRRSLNTDYIRECNETPGFLEYLTSYYEELAQSKITQENIEKLNTFLAFYPDHVKALLLRESYFCSVKDAKGAIKDLIHVLDIEPENSSALVNLRGIAKWYIKNGNYSEALTTVDAILSKLPDSKTLRLMGPICTQLTKEGEILLAIEALDKYLSKVEVSEYHFLSALSLRATLHNQVNQYQLALEDARLAIKHGCRDLNVLTIYQNLHDQPLTIEGLTKKAEACFEKREWRDALTYLTKALRVDPHYVPALFAKAKCYFQLYLQKKDHSFLPGLEAVCKEILKVDPEHVNTLVFKHVIQELQSGYFIETSEDFERAKGKNLLQALTYRGVLYAELEWYPEALRIYEEVLLIDPNYRPALEECSKLLRKASQIFELAESNFREYLRQGKTAFLSAAKGLCNTLFVVNPDNIKALVLKHIIEQLENNTFEGPSADFERAKSKNLLQALTYRGHLYRQLDKHQKALEDYKAALRIDPNYAPAKAGKKRLPAAILEPDDSRISNLRTLGLSDGATGRDIRKRYRELALQLHPDKNPEKGASKRFNDIQAAYEALTGRAARM